MHESLHLYSGSMSVNSPTTVRQFISDNFPYVDNQSMLWGHFALLGLLEANPTEYIDCIKLAVGKYHCECDLQMQYRLGACSSDRDRLISLVDLNQGVTFKGICPVHPGRNKHGCYCDKHKPDNQAQTSTFTKKPFKTVEQYISENFPYVDNQSMLWYSFGSSKLLGLDSAEYINEIKLGVGQYHCKCDLRLHYLGVECGIDRDELVRLVNPGIASKGICPVHPGRDKRDYYCNKHEPNNQCQSSTSGKGARRREQRKRAKARKMINEGSLITNELNC